MQWAVTEELAGINISGVRTDSTQFRTIMPLIGDDQLMDDLFENNVEIVANEPEQQSIWSQLLVASFPILIIIALFFFFMRQMQGGGAGGRGGPMSFGKSKAKLLGEDQIKVTFADVAGVDEAKDDDIVAERFVEAAESVSMNLEEWACIWWISYEISDSIRKDRRFNWD